MYLYIFMWTGAKEPKQKKEEENKETILAP
jgi:hypothetical protein